MLPSGTIVPSGQHFGGPPPTADNINILFPITYYAAYATENTHAGSECGSFKTTLTWHKMILYICLHRCAARRVMINKLEYFVFGTLYHIAFQNIRGNQHTDLAICIYASLTEKPYFQNFLLNLVKAVWITFQFSINLT